MKTVVNYNRRVTNGKNEIKLNAAFVDFARYYQFEIFVCPPHWPQTKGKVEATIKYVRRYFPRVTPKHNTTLEELNTRLTKWINDQAHQRIHGTTHEKPYERWLEERPYLKFPTNLPPYNASPLEDSTTTEHGLLIKNGITYNLGPAYIRRKLEVREVYNHGLPHLEIYRQNKHVVTVPIPAKRHSWVSIEQEAPESAASHQTTPLTQRAGKQSAAYNIEVEQRDLSYYSLGVL
jgi:hypothetical protein